MALTWRPLHLLHFPSFEVAPKAVPTVLTLEVNMDFVLLAVTLTNNTGSDSTIQVLDNLNQVVVPSQVLVNKGELYYFKEVGRFMSGGLQWSSSVSGVIGSIVGMRT